MSHALDFPVCVAGNYFIASVRGGSRKGGSKGARDCRGEREGRSLLLSGLPPGIMDGPGIYHGARGLDTTRP